MKNISSSLLASTLLATCCFAGQTFAGPAPAPAVPIQAKASDNPLSFYDGKVVFDLQERLRYVDQQNVQDFNRGADALSDGNWFLNRFRLGLLLRPTEWVKVYAQAQDVRQFDAGIPLIPGQNGAQGDDAFDLYQGYVEIANYDKSPFGLRIGRQVLQYGSERLIGPGNWNNFGRSFDAAKIRYQEKGWWAEAFVGTVAVNKRSEYNQSDLFNGTETNRGQVFTGVYFSSDALVPIQTTDLYAFYLDQNSGPMSRPAAYGRDTSFVTLGARVKSKPGVFHHEPSPAPTDGKSVVDGKSAPAPEKKSKKAVGFDYDAEFVFQTGEAGSLDLTAFAVHAGIGYTFDMPWSPRIGLEYNYGSGDSDPTDGKIETFQNLFPSNHNPYGNMDEFSWQNMSNPAIIITAAPTKTISAQLEFHGFWLANTNDYWYQSNGTTTVRSLNSAARSASSFAGTELDFFVTWQPVKQLQIQGGYSHFFAGDYLRDTGPHSDAQFAYIQTMIQF